MPSQRIAVAQRRRREAARIAADPPAAGFDEQCPVGLRGWKALADLGRLVVHLTDSLACAQGVSHVLHARLIHERLTVDRRSVEAHAALERRARQVFDHHVSVMRPTGVGA